MSANICLTRISSNNSAKNINFGISYIIGINIRLANEAFFGIFL